MNTVLPKGTILPSNIGFLSCGKPCLSISPIECLFVLTTASFSSSFHLFDIMSNGSVSSLRPLLKCTRTVRLVMCFCLPFVLTFFSILLSEPEQEDMDEEDEMLSEIEVEQAPPVVPIPAPVEPPVKRKRGRPPKNKPASEWPVCTQRYCL